MMKRRREEAAASGRSAGGNQAAISSSSSMSMVQSLVEAGSIHRAKGHFGGENDSAQRPEIKAAAGV
jgi:hypothetical protein